MAHNGGFQPHEHVPTLESRAKVVGFTCAGYTHDDISKYLGISDETLRKHYRDELDKAKMENIVEISGIAYKRAREGSEKMIEFILRHQGKWAPYKSPEDIEKDKKQTSLMERLMDKL